MSPTVAILVTLVAYKIALLGFGVWAQRRTKDGADFFLGGRKLGPTVAAVSSAASSSSAWTLLGVSGAAYAWGLPAVWIFPGCVAGFVLNWYVLARPLQGISHASGALTVTEVLAGPEGTPLRRPIAITASVIVLISLAAYVAAQFQGAGKTFAETFGVSETSSVLLGSGVVVIYTLLGGFWAVSLTDTLQGAMMALASLVLPIAALVEVGGPSGLLEGLAALEVDGFTHWTRDGGGAAGLGFVVGLLGIGLGYPGQPHVVNRFMALEKTESALRRGRRIAVSWSVVVYAGMLILGWSGRVLFTELADKEVVMLAAANQLFHPIVAGVIIAAVLSAIMSTADSQLLVAASSVTHDLQAGGANNESLVWRSRVVIVLLSAAAVLAALFGTREIFTRVLFAWTAMGSAFGPLLLVRALRGPIPPPQTLAAMVVGFGGSVLAYSFDATRGGVVERILPFAVALLIALWRPPARS